MVLEIITLSEHSFIKSRVPFYIIVFYNAQRYLLFHPILCTHYVGVSLVMEHSPTHIQPFVQSTLSVLTFTPRREHISPVLRSLHWLPIHRRIEFKIILLVYLCLHDIAPQYLAEMLTTHAVTRSLRSTDKQLLVVPRSKLKRHGDRSFNVVAPVLWNSLPECMKSSSSVASFKRTLKTFLFRQEYGVIN